MPDCEQSTLELAGSVSFPKNLNSHTSPNRVLHDSVLHNDIGMISQGSRGFDQSAVDGFDQSAVDRKKNTTCTRAETFLTCSVIAQSQTELVGFYELAINYQRNPYRKRSSIDHEAKTYYHHHLHHTVLQKQFHTNCPEGAFCVGEPQI